MVHFFLKWHSGFRIRLCILVNVIDPVFCIDQDRNRDVLGLVSR